MKSSIGRYLSMPVIVSLFLLVCLPFYSSAKFPVSEIPEELLVDANSVFRVNNMHVKIESPSSYTIMREIAVTILNENGKGPDIMVMSYDKYSKADFIDGVIYDATGKVIEKIRKKNLIDRSMINDFSLYEDNRILAYQPIISSYPYTVHYRYEEIYSRGLYYTVDFFPNMNYNISVEDAQLRIDYPDDMEIRFKVFPSESVVKNEPYTTGRMQLFCQYENVAAVTKEYLSPGIKYSLPGIFFSPNKFEFAGYYGTSNSWQEFGSWQWQMNKGRDDLPQSRIEHLQALVADLDSDREKVKAVYEFMQSRTRYVNITLGVGGLQPFSAETVEQNGYGDCKALTNYMMAMLKAIGIESHYTLVKAGLGKYDFYKDFSAFQFNHAILCVPLNGDTVWLECTSQITPFGHLGDFTDNRPVLVIREDGGHLTSTYGYNPEENLKTSYLSVNLTEDGHADASISLVRGGIYFVDYQRQMRMSPDDQKKWIYQAFAFPNYELKEYSLEAPVEAVPLAHINLDVSLRSLASISGNRMILSVSDLLGGAVTPVRVRNRTQPFVEKFPTTYTDTLVINLPDKYYAEAVPPDLALESEFGDYSISFLKGDNKVVFVRKLTVKGGMFEPDLYQDYFRFFQSISRADKQQIIFSRD